MPASATLHAADVYAACNDASGPSAHWPHSHAFPISGNASRNVCAGLMSDGVGGDSRVALA